MPKYQLIWKSVVTVKGTVEIVRTYLVTTGAIWKDCIKRRKGLHGTIRQEDDGNKKKSRVVKAIIMDVTPRFKKE